MIDASTITTEPAGDFAWEAVLSTLVARAIINTDEAITTP